MYGVDEWKIMHHTNGDGDWWCYNPNVPSASETSQRSHIVIVKERQREAMLSQPTHILRPKVDRLTLRCHWGSSHSCAERAVKQFSSTNQVFLSTCSLSLVSKPSLDEIQRSGRSLNDTCTKHDQEVLISSRGFYRLSKVKHSCAEYHVWWWCSWSFMENMTWYMISSGCVNIAIQQIQADLCMWGQIRNPIFETDRGEK